MSLFCWTQRKIFWRMWETEQFWGTIDFHSIFFLLWKSIVPQNSWLQTFFRISSFVFGRTKKFIQVWNYLRVSKWWQNFHFWVNYPFNVFGVVLSRYQNFCIAYQYQLKSTVLGTNFGTKAKHKNMLIKKTHYFLLIKLNKNKLYKKINAILYANLQFSSFSTSNKSIKKTSFTLKFLSYFCCCWKTVNCCLF